MKKSKFSDEQIVKILAEADSSSVTKAAGAHQDSEQTIYTWRRKYRGLQVSDVGKMRELERENAELKAMLAEAQLELRAAGKLIQKNGWRP
jgi:putative transposase